MLGLAVLASWDAGAREAEGVIEPQVTVYLVGGGVAPLPLLAQGKQTASKILTQAGVRLRWVSGTPLLAPDAASARREAGRSARTIILTLAEKAPQDLPPEAFARALPYGGDPGSATVFYDRIAPVLGAVQFWAGAVFGHVLAHEITHVLQMMVRHSETGVMRSHWVTKDYSAMIAGRLRLTALDVNLIHAGLAHAVRARAGTVLGSTPPVALSASAIAPAGNK